MPPCWCKIACLASGVQGDACRRQLAGNGPVTGHRVLTLLLCQGSLRLLYPHTQSCTFIGRMLHGGVMASLQVS